MQIALWPAIDLRGGRVVRLLRGELSETTTYDANPADVARRFESEGADGIHVVDLDAAFGLGESRAAVRDILRAVGLPVQVGGGVKTRDEADRLFQDGAARVVLGSVLFTEAAAAGEMAAAFASRLVGALDCREGRPTIRGWTEDAGAASAADAARVLARLGLSAVLVTDVARDGAMEGPNVELLAEVRAVFAGEILASGGIRGPGDVAPVARALSGGPAGLIVGRALHAGHTTVAALAAACRGGEAR